MRCESDVLRIQYPIWVLRLQRLFAEGGVTFAFDRAPSQYPIASWLTQVPLSRHLLCRHSAIFILYVISPAEC